MQARKEDWSLVATRCVEAGVNFSFRCAFRERFTTASTIQTGGRVNRHGEYNVHGGGIVYDFALIGDGITQHPAAEVSSEVLRELMAKDQLNSVHPSELVTTAMRLELAALGGLSADSLLKAESARDYPKVKELGRVIDADTRLVVVDPRLKQRLAARQRVDFRMLLSGSVQLWAAKIEKLDLEPLPGREDLYIWNDAYDPEFLGYMEGVLRRRWFLANGGGIV